MLERIDRVVFYFTIDCAICHNHVNVSHVTIEEKKGQVECSLCGKAIRFPDFERISQSAKVLNEFLADTNNAKFVKLTMNDKYKEADNTPAAAH